MVGGVRAVDLEICALEVLGRNYEEFGVCLFVQFLGHVSGVTVQLLASFCVGGEVWIQ